MIPNKWITIVGTCVKHAIADIHIQQENDMNNLGFK